LISGLANPDAKNMIWLWIKLYVNRLKVLYEGTGVLSRLLKAVIPFLGVGRVKELVKFFEEKKLPEAETGIKTGLERLQIYDKLVKEYT